MISQTRGQRNVLFADRTDAQMKFLLQRRTEGVVRDQGVLRSFHDDAVKLNALVQRAVVGRLRLPIGRGRVHFDQTNAARRPMERNGRRKETVRKQLNVIRTPRTTTFRFCTTNDLNGVLSLEDVRGAPVPSRVEM